MKPSKSAAPSRPQTFEQMTPAMQEMARDVEEKLAGEKRDSLLLRHEMGQSVKQLIEGRAVYGAHAVQQLAHYLGSSPDRLYKLRTFHDLYPREQIEQWADRTMASGGRITFGHLAAIMVIKSEEQRLALVERVFKESLGVRALRQIIEDTGPDKRKTSKGGRRPASIVGGLEQLITRGKSLLKGFPVWQKTVFDGIHSARPQSIEPVVRNRLVEAQNLLGELTTEITAARERLENSLEEVNHLLGGS